ncbi:MAG: hypothetical protein K0R66_371 [Gammaproteobacteria bacterium]|jgi:hypothetical protein|nr:hypothetical protein [Gammaproteobacteria bacterium]
MKQEGFIFVSMLLLSMLLSILALASISQSKLEAYFARNLLERMALEQSAYRNLFAAEMNIAKNGLAGPNVHLIAHVPNSLNYSDHGGVDIVQIIVRADSLIVKAMWWQRLANQFYVPAIQRFLAKDGKFYQLKVQHRPLRLEFNGKAILLPKTISYISQPLLVDSTQLHYADRLYLIDNQGHIDFIDLHVIPSQWRLTTVAKLSEWPLLSIPLWAGLSSNDEVELYVATQKGIEAWQVTAKVKQLWQAKISHLASFFLEGKRLWYIKDSGFNQLKIGALDRLTGQSLPGPLFGKAPEQTELEFSPQNTDYNWRLVSDNLKKVEILSIAGAEILLYPPQYEMGQQRLTFLSLKNAD